MNQRVATFLAVALLGVASYAPAIEAADPEFTLRLKDHRFAPSELTIPAGQKVRLIIENQDATAEEFESYELNREKVVPGNGRIVVFIGPLKPGRYEFFGEFNAATARGSLIAR
jgi:plastocyanin